MKYRELIRLLKSVPKRYMNEEVVFEKRAYNSPPIQLIPTHLFNEELAFPLKGSKLHKYKRSFRILCRDYKEEKGSGT